MSGTDNPPSPGTDLIPTPKMYELTQVLTHKGDWMVMDIPSYLAAPPGEEWEIGKSWNAMTALSLS